MTQRKMKIKLGRKFEYEDSEELEEKIREYFNQCQKERLVPGICGLASYLGITRNTLLNYQKSEKLKDHADVIQRAKTLIEAYNEQILYCKNNTGAQFILRNNFGYNADQKHVNENVDISYEEYLKGLNSEDDY